MDVEPNLIHRLFYPQVPLVLSATHGGRASAMPVVSYALVSSDPPIVAASCASSSYTCKLVVRSRAFSLSVLGRSRKRSMELLASSSGSEVRDKLKAAGIRHVEGRVLEVPVVVGAQATLECSLRSSRRVGDHVLLLGEVKASYATAAFTDKWDFRRYKPVLYTGWRGGMTTYPED